MHIFVRGKKNEIGGRCSKETGNNKKAHQYQSIILFLDKYRNALVS